MKKTEEELIATVANILEGPACLLFAERARAHGMPGLATACEERAEALRRFNAPSVKRASRTANNATKPKMKTHAVAEQALALLIEDYTAGLPATTYGKLAERCGVDGQKRVRWIGQVTDLIDAACALAGLASFALVRVRKADGTVNCDAWRKEHSELRDAIIARARKASWSDEDFTRIHSALAHFSANGWGNKKAWAYVQKEVNLREWARDAE